jgi:ABC-2 type transport system permease protein
VAIGEPLVAGGDSDEARGLLAALGYRGVPQDAAATPDIEALRAAGLRWALVLPPGFDSDYWDLRKTLKVELRALPSLSPAVLRALQSSVERSLIQLRLQQVLKPQLAQAGVALDAEALVRIDAIALGREKTPQSAVQHSVPAWLTFGMFFIVIPLSTIVIGERQHGTLFRLLSLQVPASRLLLGKCLPFFLINQLQAVSMLLIGVFVVPRLGGDPLTLEFASPLLWLVTGAISLAALGFAFLIASMARSSEQATMLGGVGSILFGALGGIMVPTLVMPDAMRALAALSPMNWGMEALLEVLGGAPDRPLVWRSIALLALFGLGTLALAVRRLGREFR